MENGLREVRPADATLFAGYSHAVAETAEERESPDLKHHTPLHLCLSLQEKNINPPTLLL